MLQAFESVQPDMERSLISYIGGDPSLESWTMIKEKISDRDIIFIVKIKNYCVYSKDFKYQFGDATLF